MQTNEQNKRYVADEYLGEATLFRSFLGQRLGLMNTKVASWIVFGEDRLKIGTMPNTYQKKREICYRDIASVSIKRYINLYGIIIVALCAIAAFVTAGVGLICAAVVLWSALGCKLEIKTRDGNTYNYWSVSSPSHYSDFMNKLQTIISCAQQDQECLSMESETADVASRLFIQRDMNMGRGIKESWDIMLGLLRSGKGIDEMFLQLEEKIQGQKGLATMRSNEKVYQEIQGKVAPYLQQDEVILFCAKTGLTSASKNYMLLTNRRIAFFYGKNFYGEYYENIYRLMHLSQGAYWFINGPLDQTEESLNGVYLDREQTGIVLAIICKYYEERRAPGHKIAICGQ